MEWITSFFGNVGGYLTIAGAVLGIIFKIVQLRRDTERRMIKAMGEGRFMDLMLQLNTMTDMVPIDKLGDLLRKAKTELDMKDITTDLGIILAVKKTLVQPKVKEVLDEYKRRNASYGVIANRKRWNELRKDPDIKKALKALEKHLIDKFMRQAELAKEKGNVDQIKQLVASMTSNENVLKNRERRKKLEALNDELRTREKELSLDAIKERLHDIFKGETKK